MPGLNSELNPSILALWRLLFLYLPWSKCNICQLSSCTGSSWCTVCRGNSSSSSLQDVRWLWSCLLRITYLSCIVTLNRMFNFIRTRQWLLAGRVGRVKGLDSLLNSPTRNNIWLTGRWTLKRALYGGSLRNCTSTAYLLWTILQTTSIWWR